MDKRQVLIDIDNTIQGINTKLIDLGSYKSNVMNALQRIRNRIGQIDTDNSNLSQQIKSYKNELLAKNSEIFKLRGANQQLQEKINKLNQDKESAIANFRTKIAELEEKIKNLETKISEKEQMLAESSNLTDMQKVDFETQLINEKRELQTQLDICNREKREFETQIGSIQERYNDEMSKLNSIIQENDQYTIELTNKVTELLKRVAELLGTVPDKKIADLIFEIDNMITGISGAPDNGNSPNNSIFDIITGYIGEPVKTDNQPVKTDNVASMGEEQEKNNLTKALEAINATLKNTRDKPFINIEKIKKDIIPLKTPSSTPSNKNKNKIREKILSYLQNKTDINDLYNTLNENNENKDIYKDYIQKINNFLNINTTGGRRKTKRRKGRGRRRTQRGGWTYPESGKVSTNIYQTNKKRGKTKTKSKTKSKYNTNTRRRK
jgi:hypothetical protein